MRLNKLKKCFLVFLLLGSFLCVFISSPKAQNIDTNKCIDYFTEILEIQGLRRALMLGVEKMIKRYERGKMTKKQLDSTLSIWHTTESELRRQATNIYDIAYAEKCFDNTATEDSL